MIKVPAWLALSLGIGLAALPASALLARITTSEATGNWAGPGGDGFHFLAQLSFREDQADLKIWNSASEIPDGKGTPDLAVDGFALIAFATSQRLEIIPSTGGSRLQVVTEFADEEAEGREVVQLQFIDNQFTLVGYYSLVSVDDLGMNSKTFECDIDFITGKIINDGRVRYLPSMSAEDLNASNWFIGAAFDHGWCQRSE